MSIQLRKGTLQDVPAILGLIKELAAFEKASNSVVITEAQLAADGFGPTPCYQTIVAEIDHQITGLCLYYFRYSTWEGKKLYIEDLIVSQAARRQGLGEQLMQAAITAARQTGCTGLNWQVLDWNQPAIDFYKKMNAQLDDEWINCSLSFLTNQHGR